LPCVLQECRNARLPPFGASCEEGRFAGVGTGDRKRKVKFTDDNIKVRSGRSKRSERGLNKERS